MISDPGAVIPDPIYLVMSLSLRPRFPLIFESFSSVNDIIPLTFFNLFKCFEGLHPVGEPIESFIDPFRVRSGPA